MEKEKVNIIMTYRYNKNKIYTYSNWYFYFTLYEKH